MSYKKEVQNMSDEELNAVFDRQYKERWLRQDRAKRQTARLKLIALGLIAVIIIGTIAVITIRSKLYITIMVDTNNDGYVEVITIPKWKVDEYPNRIQ